MKKKVQGGKKLQNSKASLQSNFERTFWCFQFSQKMNENVCPSRLGQKFEFSRSYLGALKTPKFLFKINRPLVYINEFQSFEATLFLDLGLRK